VQIASRLWHKPFGLFIDATCYSGQNEPPDELFQKLEALTPTELSRQLSRVYIYNMNSTFRQVLFPYVLYDKPYLKFIALDHV